MQVVQVVEKKNRFFLFKDGEEYRTVVQNTISSTDKGLVEAIANGDVAIIKKYGNIPVWQTDITEEMLFEKQKTDPYYQALVEVIRREKK